MLYREQDYPDQYEEALRKQQVIFASNKKEVYFEMERVYRGEHTTAYQNATILHWLITKWKHTDDWSVLNHKRVLDLGSGSSLYRLVNVAYHPHFARFCAYNGADVIALDILPQVGIDRAMFSWDQVDLLQVVMAGKLSRLPILQGQTFDVIHSQSFIGSGVCPKLLDQLDQSGVDVLSFQERCFKQVIPMLAEGGIMTLGVTDEHVHYKMYTKLHGHLVRV
jgi:hypothetical protein